jgi:hypothetical protein
MQGFRRKWHLTFFFKKKMACQHLAQVYAQATNNPIPDANADMNTVRAPWLITQTKACQTAPPESKILTTEQECAEAKQTVPGMGDFQQPYVLTGLPMSIIQESGFLAYVNERGSQCINKLNGIINPIVIEDGKPYKEANLEVPHSKVYCVNECFNFLPSSTECFQCVQNVIAQLPAEIEPICPELFEESKSQSVAPLVQECVTCLSCIGSKWSNLVKTTEVKDSRGVVSFVHEYNLDSFNNVWTCVTGASSGLSTGAIVGIVIGVAAFLALVITWIYFVVKHSRKKKVISPVINDSPSFVY